jgi:hypothetical protein
MFENDAIKLSSFVEGQTRSLKRNSFLIGVLAPRRHATSGWIIPTGTTGLRSTHVSIALYGLCVCHVQYTPIALCFFGERERSRSPEVHR